MASTEAANLASEAMKLEASNLAAYVLRHGQEGSGREERVAIRFAGGEAVTFGALAERIGRFRVGLKAEGFVTGDRVVVLFPVSVDLYAFCLALMAEGMAAVFIDQGMGPKKMLRALKDAAPQGVVSMRGILRKWPLVNALWGVKRYAVDGRAWGVGAAKALVGDVEAEGACVEVWRPGEEHEDMEEDEKGTTALITFTSGTSGRPKGANRTHDLLLAQHFALAGEFPHEEAEVDMPAFPVVVLHNLCAGITTVFPDVDLKAPGAVDGAKLVGQIQAEGVSRMAGAPAYLERFLEAVAERRASQERSGEMSLKTIVCGGAPVSRGLIRRAVELLPDVDKWVIYGSTEAEPIARVRFEEVLAARGEGRGYLVGRVANDARVRLLQIGGRAKTGEFVRTGAEAIHEAGVEAMSVEAGAENGGAGEIFVRGPHVLRHYLVPVGGDRAADREHKFWSAEGVWHRTGDCARIDEKGRLWLLGRAKDLFYHGGTLVFPFEVEAELDEIEGVKKAVCLAHRGAIEGEVVVEVREGLRGDKVEEVLGRVRAWCEGEGYRWRVRRVEEIPRDGRHNSKVDRVRLRARLA